MTKDYTLKNKKGFKLTEDQNEIVEKLLENPRFLLSAQTGFGKTLSAITAAVHMYHNNKDKDMHFVLLLPHSAVKAFQDTLSKILGIAYNVYTATRIRTQEGARFHIFNYTTIGKDVIPSEQTIKAAKGGKVPKKRNPIFEQLKKLKLDHKNLFLIADEAHALQDPKSVQYKLVKTILPWFNCGFWALTATPVLNDLEGLFHMMVLINPNFSHGNIWAFKKKYFVYDENAGYFITGFGGKKIFKKQPVVIGYKNLDILKERLQELSITKSKEYDIDFIYRSTNMNKATELFYNQAVEGLFSGTLTKSGKTKSKKGKTGAVLADIQQVISNSHPEFKMLKDPKRLTEKEVLLINTVREVINREEAVLIYASYLSTVERLKYIFNLLKDKFDIPHVYEITGNVQPRQRAKIESSILPRGIVIINQAGSESVNLQKASNIIFYEVPFSIRQFIQAVGRITRMDSKYNKFYCYILEVSETIDTYKRMRVEHHMGTIKNLMGKDNTLPVELANISLEDIEVMKKEYLWRK